MYKSISQLEDESSCGGGSSAFYWQGGDDDKWMQVIHLFPPGFSLGLAPSLRIEGEEAKRVRKRAPKNRDLAQSSPILKMSHITCRVAHILLSFATIS